MTDLHKTGIWHARIDEFTLDACKIADGATTHGPVDEVIQFRCHCVMYTGPRRSDGLIPFKTFVPWSKAALFVQAEIRDAPEAAFAEALKQAAAFDAGCAAGFGMIRKRPTK